MPYNSPRTPDSGGTAAWQLPVPRNLAILILVALVVLWALRHVFGAIEVRAGVN